MCKGLGSGEKSRCRTDGQVVLHLTPGRTSGISPGSLLTFPRSSIPADNRMRCPRTEGQKKCGEPERERKRMWSEDKRRQPIPLNDKSDFHSTLWARFIWLEEQEAFCSRSSQGVCPVNAERVSCYMHALFLSLGHSPTESRTPPMVHPFFPLECLVTCCLLAPTGWPLPFLLLRLSSMEELHTCA